MIGKAPIIRERIHHGWLKSTAEIANELSDRYRWSFLNCLTRLLSPTKRKKKDRNRSSEMGSRAHFLGQGSGFEKSDHVRGIFQTTGGSRGSGGGGGGAVHRPKGRDRRSDLFLETQNCCPFITCTNVATSVLTNYKRCLV